MGEKLNKDRRKNKRKLDQVKAFGHSSNAKKVNPEKIHKQKQKKCRANKSAKKYLNIKGGTK
jgi:hypothetical protein